MSNKNTGPSPFHKKGKNEGDYKRGLWGDAFRGDFGAGRDKWGEDDEWGIAAGQAKVDKAFGEP